MNKVGKRMQQLLLTCAGKIKKVMGALKKLGYIRLSQVSSHVVFWTSPRTGKNRGRANRGPKILVCIYMVPAPWGVYGFLTHGQFLHFIVHTCRLVVFSIACVWCNRVLNNPSGLHDYWAIFFDPMLTTWNIHTTIYYIPRPPLHTSHAYLE